MDTRCYIMRCACLLPQLSLCIQFCLSTEGWLRLVRAGCFVLRPDGLPVQTRSVIHPGINRNSPSFRSVFSSAYPQRDGSGWLDLGISRAWQTVTKLIKTSVLPLSQTYTDGALPDELSVNAANSRQ